jgi:hypothetical protein
MHRRSFGSLSCIWVECEALIFTLAFEGFKHCLASLITILCMKSASRKCIAACDLSELVV